MTKIFISGSRSICKLNALNKDFLDKCIKEKQGILVGDADGVDFLVQEYLFKKKYSDIKVFTVNKTARNNVGSFEVSYCNIPEGTFPKEVFGVKDEEMRKICNEGYVIWDGESKGSENNIKDLLKRGKKVTISVNGKHILWQIEEPFSKRKFNEKISGIGQTSLF